MDEKNGASQILAVVVTSEDCPYVETTLKSLAAQSQEVNRILVGVRSEKTDAIETIAQAIPASIDVRPLKQSANFLDAADQLIDGDEELIWLLHSDSAPEVHAAEHLSSTLRENKKCAIVGAKQLDWDNPYHLLEVGIHATRHARRVPDIAEGEVDQGQHDDRTDVLGVGTAGMMIRREAITSMGGLAGALGPFGDGLEISRRARNAGYEVTVCPDAKVRHARQSYGEKDETFGERRTAQIYNALASWPIFFAPILLAAYIVLGIARAVVRFLTVNFELVTPEILAPWRVIPLWGKMRAEREASSLIASKQTRASRAHIWSVAQAKRQRVLRQRMLRTHEDLRDPLVIQEENAYRSNSRVLAFIVFAVTALISLVAFANRLTTGRLSGGALSPDSLTAHGILDTLASAWLASGDGYGIPMDSIWLFFVPFAAVFGDLGAAATWFLVAAIPLAALSAYLSSGVFTKSLTVRAIGALLWAFAPPMLDAVNAGHIAGLIVHMSVPALVALTLRAWQGSLRALYATAFVFAFVSAAAPIFLIVVTLVALAGFMLAPRRSFGWLWMLVPSYALLAPTIYRSNTLSQPWRFLFASAGPSVPVEPHTLSLLTFSPLTPVTFADVLAFQPAAILRFIPVVIVLVIAVSAGLKAKNFHRTRIGALIAVLGMAWAALSFFVPVSVAMDDAEYLLLGGWSGIGLSIAFMGVWLVILNGFSDVASSLVARLGKVFVAVIVSAIPLVLGGAWIFSVWATPSMLVHASDGAAPALALELENSPARSRVLALYPHENAIEAHIWRADGAELHESTMVRGLTQLHATTHMSDPLNKADDELADAIGGLSVNASDTLNVFARHGISVIIIPASIDEAQSRELKGQLNNTKGLEYVTTNSLGMFWRVNSDYASSRLAIENAKGKRQILPAGIYNAHVSLSETCTHCSLVLAERADSGWQARFTPSDGTQAYVLTPLKDDWRQAWELPTTTGTVHVSYVPQWTKPVLYIQIAVLFLTLILLAVPRSPKKEEL